MQALMQRFKEPSTWRGVIMVTTGLGIQMDPETIEAVVTFGVGAAGLVGIFTGDTA